MLRPNKVDLVKVSSWKSVGVSAKEIKPTEITLTHEIRYSDESNIILKFSNSVLIQQKLSFT